MRRITVFTLVFSAALIATIFIGSRLGPADAAGTGQPTAQAHAGLGTPF